MLPQLGFLDAWPMGTLLVNNGGNLEIRRGDAFLLDMIHNARPTLFDLETGAIFPSRSVSFCEEIFPFGRINEIPKAIELAEPANASWELSDLVAESDAVEELPVPLPSEKKMLDPARTYPQDADDLVVTDSTTLSDTDPHVPEVEEESEAMEQESEPSDSYPADLEDFDLPAFDIPPVNADNEDRIEPSEIASIDFPARNLRAKRRRDYSHLWRNEDSGTKHTVLLTTRELKPPRTLRDALNREDSPLWVEAMDREHNSHITSHTWDAVPRPSDKKVIGSRWVYTIKLNADGSIERYKARLVAQGFSQQLGVDYDQTFAPVVRIVSIRVILALATHFDWNIFQMDVATAYLNGKLHDDHVIYMELPSNLGYGPDTVARLRRGIYGTKQGGRVWNEHLVATLVGIGFTQLDVDMSVFVHFAKTLVTIVATNVDDLIITGDDNSFITKTREHLKRVYTMTEKKEFTWFLSLKIARDRKNRTMVISQKLQLEKTLSVIAGMEECNLAPTPAVSSEKLVRAIPTDKRVDATLFRSVVGGIRYAVTCTRADLSFALNNISRFMHEPTETHSRAMKRILRYIRGTTDIGLIFRGEKDIKTAPVLRGFVDSDWAEDRDTHRSCTGYLFAGSQNGNRLPRSRLARRNTLQLQRQRKKRFTLGNCWRA